MTDPFRLDGRFALVTGATRGIGLGAARALYESGASVLLVGRDQPGLSRAADSLQTAAPTDSSRPAVHIATFDLLNTAGIAPWFSSVVEQHGVPDILVNCAGITRRGRAIDLTLADWNDVMALNATAIWELSRAFARHLIDLGRPGRVINIASLMTAAARPGTSPYTASKGAVGQLTKVLAVEWAANGILVNAIAPGYIDTELNKSLVSDPEFDTWVKRRCPLGRWGTPADIAWPVVFLASEAAHFITGQTIFVDGGWLATF